MAGEVRVVVSDQLGAIPIPATSVPQVGQMLPVEILFSDTQNPFRLISSSPHLWHSVFVSPHKLVRAWLV